MPTLTRRRYPERPDCWHVYYGDVHIGTIAHCTGCPGEVDQWEWRCGFYPGMNPGQDRNGVAIDVDHARANFEAAWQRILPTLIEAFFQAWLGNFEHQKTLKVPTFPGLVSTTLALNCSLNRPLSLGASDAGPLPGCP